MIPVYKIEKARHSEIWIELPEVTGRFSCSLRKALQVLLQRFVCVLCFVARLIWPVEVTPNGKAFVFW